MSESRKNHLIIEGNQGREADHGASYKPIPEADTDFRKSKSSLSKSKEKVSAEEEKLLSKEEEAKVVTRVDMADARYVVEDHRNGDANIELDANKRQFTGLTKEELMKYAEDPFWVRLRWFMFILFWSLWLCMLAAAIAIIVRAPKCAPPPPKTWYQKGPLVDMSSVESFEELETELPLLEKNQVQGIFTYVCKDTYEVLEEPACLQQFKDFVTKAKDYGIKVIVDLTANYVSRNHSWFALSENRSAGYEDYFVWADGAGFGEDHKPNAPNNWVSTTDEPAWSYSEKRKQFFLHQLGEQADLNFTNPSVVHRFDDVLKLWMQAGAHGVRLLNARYLLVNSSLASEQPDVGAGARGAAHSQHAYWQHRHSRDLPALGPLLQHWAHLVDHAPPNTGLGETVFTLREAARPELFLVRELVLRPPSAAPLPAARPADLAAALAARLPHWPAVQLEEEEEEESEVWMLSALLPAAPLLARSQLLSQNHTDLRSGLWERVWALRGDASVEHGRARLAAAPDARGLLNFIACARWKTGHTGYVALYNAGEAGRANLTAAAPSLPPRLAVHYLSHDVAMQTNYTVNMEVSAEAVLVPARAALLLSFVPKAAVDE